MKQTLCTIRTTNFNEMRDFCRDRLRLNHLNPVRDDFIWFKDFQPEVHIQRVTSADDTGVDGFLRLLTSNVLGVSEMFRERDVPVQVRERGTATESFITDPDGNIILLVAVSDTAT
jgi:hypothetical protein